MVNSNTDGGMQQTHQLLNRSSCKTVRTLTPKNGPFSFASGWGQELSVSTRSHTVLVVCWLGTKKVITSHAISQNDTTWTFTFHILKASGLSFGTQSTKEHKNESGHPLKTKRLPFFYAQFDICTNQCYLLCHFSFTHSRYHSCHPQLWPVLSQKGP